MLGAIAVNTVLTSAAVVAALVVGIVLSYPEIAVVPILLVCLAVAVVLPIVLFPVTHTVWAAVELAMRPLAPAEEADAATYVATGLADRAPAELVDGTRASLDRPDRPDSHDPETPEPPESRDSGGEDT
jgi:hypothetical protein